MRNLNPLEPRIPTSPPYESYARQELTPLGVTRAPWEPVAGIYVTTDKELAESYAGGRAVTDWKQSNIGNQPLLLPTQPEKYLPAVMKEFESTPNWDSWKPNKWLEAIINSTKIQFITIPAILEINTEGLPIQTDPDVAFVLNESYNRFRRLIDAEEMAEERGADAAYQWFRNRRISPHELADVEGLYELLCLINTDRTADILRPIYMLEKFYGKENAWKWLTKRGRGPYLYPAKYNPLPDEFIQFAANMYVITSEINFRSLISVTSVTITDDGELLSYSQPLYDHRSPYKIATESKMYHGTTLLAILEAFPEIINHLNLPAVEFLKKLWHSFLIKKHIADEIAAEAAFYSPARLDPA